MTVRTPTLTRENIRDGLGLAAIGIAAGVTVGAAAILPTIARGWLGKQAVGAGADVLSKVLIK